MFFFLNLKADYLSFEAKDDNPTSSPVSGRRGLSSSELSNDEEFDFDFAFEFDLDRSLESRRSSSDPKMSL